MHLYKVQLSFHMIKRVYGSSIIEKKDFTQIQIPLGRTLAS